MSPISKVLFSALLSTTAISTAQAQATTAPADVAEAAPADEIIVTGTRATGQQAANAAAPVTLLGESALSKVGQPNLNQALTQLVPSFTAQTQGTDMSNFSLSARLRGLSANHTLVMVNGKRRHNSAILQVISGAFQGSASPSIDLIPPDAVQRIEILQEGAAAVYGSDAIAGVVNIILKSNTTGGSAKMSAGQYFDGEGTQYSVSGQIGLPIAESGYFDMTLFHRRNDYTYIGDGQLSVTDVTGKIYSGLTGAAANWASLDLKNINGGQAKSDLSIAFFNAGYDFGGVELYAFGDIASRIGYAKQGYRHPARICTGATVGAGGGSGTYNPANCLAGTGTTGMVPEQKVEEFEWSATGGLRGDAGGITYDLSTTYGYVKDDVSTVNTANRQLYITTGQSPRTFYDGAFKFSQWTTTLDLKKDVEVGFAEPLTIAVGAEYRRDGYSILAGEPLSYFGDGSQSFPGYSPTNAGVHSRHSKSAYINFIAKPVEKWTVDIAGRVEDYSDFGSTVIGKLTTRYDFSDVIALRGTISNGFRAPTLQEEFYSAANVGPTSIVAQLPPNSAAAAALGFSPLRAEKSTSYSGGIVLRPIPRLIVTLDGYYIKIKDRITGTSNIRGLVSDVKQTTPVINGVSAYDAVLAALVSQGYATAGLPNLSAATFTNGIDTRTWGIDFAARYPVDLSFGKLDFNLTAAYVNTKVTANRVPFGLFDVVAVSVVEQAQPKFKGLLGALFTSGRFSANLRESYTTKSVILVRPSVSGFGPYDGVVKATFLTDLELGYDVTDNLNLAIGANNLFNKKPEIPALLPAAGLAKVTPGVSPYINGTGTINAPYGHGTYGTNGGYYYARIGLKF
jgi:iron complex outermembrane receptor protein